MAPPQQPPQSEPLVKGRKTNAVYNKNGGELTVPSPSLSLCASLSLSPLVALLSADQEIWELYGDERKRQRAIKT